MYRIVIIVVIVLFVACASDKPISGDRFSFHAYSEGNPSNFELFSLVFKIDGKEQNYDYGRVSLSKYEITIIIFDFIIISRIAKKEWDIFAKKNLPLQRI